MRIQKFLTSIANKILKKGHAPPSPNANKLEPSGNFNGPPWHHLHMQPRLRTTHLAAPLNFYPPIGFPSIGTPFQFPTVMLPLYL